MAGRRCALDFRYCRTGQAKILQHERAQGGCPGRISIGRGIVGTSRRTTTKKRVITTLCCCTPMLTRDSRIKVAKANWLTSLPLVLRRRFSTTDMLNQHLRIVNVCVRRRLHLSMVRTSACLGCGKSVKKPRDSPAYAILALSCLTHMSQTLYCLCSR